MVAHLDTGVGNISGLIDRGQHMHVVPGALIIGVPLFLSMVNWGGRFFMQGCSGSSTFTWLLRNQM
jgi:hypothetical protein